MGQWEACSRFFVTSSNALNCVPHKRILVQHTFLFPLYSFSTYLVVIMVSFQQRGLPSRQSQGASSPFRKLITRQQLSPLIVEALASVRQAELYGARLAVASTIQQEEGEGRKLCYVEMQRNGGEERERKRVRMNGKESRIPLLIPLEGGSA